MLVCGRPELTCPPPPRHPPAPAQPARGPGRGGWAGGRGGRGGGAMGRGYPQYGGYGAGGYGPGGYGPGAGYNKRKGARSEAEDYARQTALQRELQYFEKARERGAVGNGEVGESCPEAILGADAPCASAGAAVAWHTARLARCGRCLPAPPQVKARLRSKESYQDLLKTLNM
jgi:hypothetical protein